ncbi:MAG: hypothetical protein O3B41_01880 [Bacteroidetes bacterium]|nr:hypothetical protein [Bacteroidota bacterium]
MKYETKAIIGWALPMFTIPAMPAMAASVAEPTVPLILGVAFVIGSVSYFIGTMFKDEE